MTSPDPILTALSQLETRLFERINHRLGEEMRALRLDIKAHAEDRTRREQVRKEADEGRLNTR